MNKEDRFKAMEEMFILLLHTSRVINKFYNAKLLKEVGISVTKMAILTVLYSNGGVMNPSEIAEATYTERNNITVHVNSMSKDGLVISERDVNNKRLVNVMLTDKGRQTMSDARHSVESTLEKLSISLTEDNIYLLERPLRILRQNGLDGVSELTQQNIGI